MTNYHLKDPKLKNAELKKTDLHPDQPSLVPAPVRQPPFFIFTVNGGQQGQVRTILRPDHLPLEASPCCSPRQ